MAIVAGVGSGSYVTEKIKSGFENFAMDKEIPGSFRLDLLPDSKIQQILYTSENKVQEEIEKHFTKELSPQIEKQILENVRSLLDSHKERIIKIIK
jgi:hypothetical protein